MPTTKRKYRILPVAEMQPGDVVKITRTIVDRVEPLADGGVRVHLTNGRSGCWAGTERFGIYRQTAAA